VLNWSVCGAGGVETPSVVVKISEAALAVKVGGGAVTSSVTLVVPGAATPTAVKPTAAVYEPVSRPVGFYAEIHIRGQHAGIRVAVSHNADAVVPVGTIAVV
jgi:hypothetical protein